MKDGTEEQTYFADTYALIEIIRGNENYNRYVNHNLVTTRINLAEFYYSLLNESGKDIADRYLQIYSKISIPITLSSIRKGMNLKSSHKKEHLSYPDCLGYALAVENNIKFLTGDIKFKDRKGVEWVR